MLPEELVKQLEDAISKFSGNEEEVKSLKRQMADIEKKLLTATADMSPHKSRELGEWDSEDHAKGFVSFMKNVFMNDTAELKQMGEGVDADGGYLVPDEFIPTLVRLIEVYGLVRRQATVVPMSRDELNMPSLANGVTVYWIGENAPITPTKPQFGQVKLIAKKLAALIPSSNELLEDSSIAIANLLATLVAEAFAMEEDRVGLVGDVGGAGDPFDGVMFDANVTSLAMGAGDTAFSNLDADDLLDLSGQVPTSATVGAGFIMHRTIFDLVRKLKDTQDNYIYNPPGATTPATLWGYPYSLSDVMPAIGASALDTPFIIFGNLRHLYLGDRKAMSIASSQHVGFANDQTYFRFIERIALKVAIGTAFAVLKTAAA